MIIITTRQGYQYRYEGEIGLSIGNIFISIRWYIEGIPPVNENELSTWRSNGFDSFWTEDVKSIVGE